MTCKIVIDCKGPVTQSTEAVRALITYQNHGVAPEELPPFYRMSPELVLVLNNRKDAYYVTTSQDCSCPSAAYRPGQHCKHQRKYFPQKAESVRTLNLADEIRPTGKWAGGYNGPVDIQEAA